MSTKKKNTKLPTEVLDAASQDRAVQMLHGPDDLFWHHRIKTLFAEAGMTTRRVERMEEHPIWQAWLTRMSFDLDPDKKAAIRQLRKILSDGGLKVVNKELNIIDRRGDQLRIVFMLDLGSPGTVYRRPARAGQAELWAETH